MDFLLTVIVLVIVAYQWHRTRWHWLLRRSFLSRNISGFSRIIEPLGTVVERSWNLARILSRGSCRLTHVLKVIFVWVYYAFSIFAQLGGVSVLRLLRLGALTHLKLLIGILHREPTRQCALTWVLPIPRVLQALCILVLVLGPMPVDYLLVALGSCLDRISRSWCTTASNIRLHSYLLLSLGCLLSILNIAGIIHVFRDLGIWCERKWLLLLILSLKCTLLSIRLVHVQRAVKIVFRQTFLLSYRKRFLFLTVQFVLRDGFIVWWMSIGYRMTVMHCLLIVGLASLSVDVTRSG